MLSFIFTTFAFAASYTSTFSFDTTLTGATRNYTGKNISISATSAQSAQILDHNTYTVSLYRKGTFSSDLIGSAVMPRDGFGKKEWTNVGDGKYYFYFSKTHDAVWLTSDDVTMFNS